MTATEKDLTKETKDDELIYIDDQKNEVLCTILFTFHSDEYKKDYILFYPKAEAKAEEINVIAAIYDPKEFETESDADKTLSPIESDEEWALVQEELDKWQKTNDVADDEPEDKAE